MSIRYTPGQLQEALELTKETFRYWKRNLPFLAAGSGHSPCFGPGEVLATAIVKAVVDTMSVRVSRLAPSAPTLLALCRDSAWPQLERRCAVFFLESGRVQLSGLSDGISDAEAMVVVPLKPVIERLRARLLEADVQTQPSLNFPPVSIGAQR